MIIIIRIKILLWDLPLFEEIHNFGFWNACIQNHKLNLYMWSVWNDILQYKFVWYVLFVVCRKNFLGFFRKIPTVATVPAIGTFVSRMSHLPWMGGDGGRGHDVWNVEGIGHINMKYMCLCCVILLCVVVNAFVHVCIYVCVCACVLYMYVYVYAYVHVYIYVCMCMCMHMFMYK